MQEFRIDFTLVSLEDQYAGTPPPGRDVKSTWDYDIVGDIEFYIDGKLFFEERQYYVARFAVDLHNWLKSSFPRGKSFVDDDQFDGWLCEFHMNKIGNDWEIKIPCLDKPLISVLINEVELEKGLIDFVNRARDDIEDYWDIKIIKGEKLKSREK